MGDLVNLNRARKARDKAEDKAKAGANRAAHGRIKAERLATGKARADAARELDGKKRD